METEVGAVSANAEFLMLVVVLIVQGATAIWWASGMTSRVKSLESNHSGFDRDQRATDQAVQDMKVTMALLNQSFGQVTQGLEKMDARLAKIEAHLSEDAKK